MKHFVVYDVATGAVLRTGVCPPEQVQFQAQPGEGVIEAAPGVVAVAEVNLGPVRESICADIDREAEAQRGRFLTPGAGQAAVYQRKEFEARSYCPGWAGPHPLLTAEAEATGKPIAEVAAEIVERADAWLDVAAKIEGARLKAKADVRAADGIPAMREAAAIDWETVLA